MDPGAAGLDDVLTVPSWFRIAPGCAGFAGSLTKMPGPVREIVNVPIPTDWPPESMVIIVLPAGAESGTTKFTCEFEVNSGFVIIVPMVRPSGAAEKLPKAAA